jgi:hypothetical protein
MKRGQEVLSKETALAVVAVIIVGIMIVSILPKISFLFGSSPSNKEKAENMLIQLKNSLDFIPEGQEDDIYVYFPKDLFLVTFSNNEGPSGFVFPNNLCAYKNCTCICDERCSEIVYCKEISKPLKFYGKDFSKEIPFDARIKNNPSEYDLIDSTEGGKEESKTIQLTSKDADALGIKGIIFQYPMISWKRASQSDVQYVILHDTEGSTFQDAYSYMKSEGLSVHYMIDRDGKIYYLVNEKRGANHARGMNEESIGIEIVNTGRKNDPFTDAQYTSIKILLTSITNRGIANGWNIKYDDAHILGHFQTENGKLIGKRDPSPNFNWASINLQGHEIVNLAIIPKEWGYGGYA